MSLIKYVFELIIIVYIVNIGLKFLGGIFSGTQDRNFDPLSKMKKPQDKSENLSNKVDAEYIDYEEVK
jgi:hypothetical protein